MKSHPVVGQHDGTALAASPRGADTFDRATPPAVVVLPRLASLLFSGLGAEPLRRLEQLAPVVLLGPLLHQLAPTELVLPPLPATGKGKSATSAAAAAVTVAASSMNAW